MEDNRLMILPPLYLVGIKIDCWKCDKKLPVVALVAPNVEDTDDEVCILSGIVHLPSEILDYLKKRVPTFKFRYSKTVGGRYFANTCPSCGMLSGDFFLHSEPGAPFFPTSEEEASHLFLTEIPLEAPVHVHAGLQMGAGDLIVRNAKRIK